MKGIIFTSILCIIFTAAGFTQNIHGTITDTKGAPLFGATVHIIGTTNGTSSNADGSYAIDNAQGTLEFSFIGYQSQIIKIDGETSIINVQLQANDYLFEDVVVRSTRVNQSSPFSYTNIDNKALNERSNGEEMPQLLNISPSVVSYSENGTPFGNTAFRVRGSDPSRVNVTLDGIPMNDAESQSVFWVNMSDIGSSIKDIQIQRGVGASTNGSAAFGASVNIQSSAFIQDASAQVSTTMGSYNTFKRTVKVNSGVINNHASFSARVSKLTSDGYIDYSGMEHTSYFFAGAYFTDRTSLRVKLFGNNEHTQISWWGNPSDKIEEDRTYNPAGWYTDINGNTNYYEDQADNYVQTHLHTHLSHEINSNNQLNFAFHYTWGEGYYEQFQDDDNWMHDSDFEYYGMPDAVYIQPSGDSIYGSDLIRRRMMDNDFYGVTYAYEHAARWGTLVVGGAANRYDGEHFGRVIWLEQNPGFQNNHEYYYNTSLKDEASLYVKGQFALSNTIEAYADVQYRYIDYTLEGANSSTDKPDIDVHENYNFVNPKLGLSYQQNNHNVYASFGMAHREPTRANLKDAIGDPRATPQPETLYNTELGYKVATTNLAVEASLYYMHYKDQLVPTGEKNNVGYDIMSNVSTSYRTGIELAASYQPVQWFRWDANLTLSKNIIKDFIEYNTYYDQWYWNAIDYKGTERGNTPIAYSPNVNASSNLVFYPTKALAIQLTSKYVGEQYFDNTGDEAAILDAYFVNDLSVSYTHKLNKIESIECKVKVNNIFNNEYIGNGYGGKDMVQDADDSELFHATRWTYYFPQAPANLLVQLNINF